MSSTGPVIVINRLINRLLPISHLPGILLILIGDRLSE
jgi:hypothetical protein